MMKGMLGIAVLALLTTGCATNSSVKKQIDPISDRLTNVETQLADMNRKLDTQAGDLQAAQKTLADMNTAAQAAKQSAAASAADKAAKAFELGQRKGAR